MIFSSAFSICLLFLTVIFPFFILFFMYKMQPRLADEEYVVRVGSMYEGLKVSSLMALMYNVFFIGRRLVFGILVVFLRDYPTF